MITEIEVEKLVFSTSGTTTGSTPVVQPIGREDTPKPKCGPDVTEHYLQGIINFMDACDAADVEYPERWEVGGREADLYDANGLDRHGRKLGLFLRLIMPLFGTVNYKAKRGAYPECATEGCENTVRLCEVCVPDDVPGNIAFGLGFAYANLGSSAQALDISNAQNRASTIKSTQPLGNNDSKSDKAAVAAGHKLGDKLKAGRKAGRSRGVTGKGTPEAGQKKKDRQKEALRGGHL